MDRISANRRSLLIGAAASVAAAGAAATPAVGEEAAVMAEMEAIIAEIDAAQAEVAARFVVFNELETAIIHRGERTEESEKALNEAEDWAREALAVETGWIEDLVDYRPRTFAGVRRKCGYLLTCRPWRECFAVDTENTIALVESLATMEA